MSFSELISLYLSKRLFQLNHSILLETLKERLINLRFKSFILQTFRSICDWKQCIQFLLVFYLFTLIFLFFYWFLNQSLPINNPPLLFLNLFLKIPNLVCLLSISINKFIYLTIFVLSFLKNLIEICWWYHAKFV